jgi:DNA-binding HxlR family transcriptional regulator
MAMASPWCTCVAGPAHCAQPFCPYYQYVAELLGRRWMAAIVRALSSGRTRFSELAALIPAISDRMVSERLKELEQEGLIERIVIPEMPVRIEYQLTPKGRALEPIMTASLNWASHWLVPSPSETHS